MSLIEYRLKRDFSKTSEPEPQQEKVLKRRFVIQEHNASVLHFDFRLETRDEQTQEVVLKSWAVPKNLPLASGIKHLAIQTEDHPVDYLDFQGEIPSGNYGAGSVKIWDKGRWGLMSGDLENGILKFNLFGEKLKGRYVLVQARGLGSPKEQKKQKNWLIWKQQDESLA